MQVKKIPFAQIGCGYWGPNLLRNVSLNPRCFLKKIVETCPARRKFIETAVAGLQTTSNINDVLIDPEIVGVIIATPAKSHFDLASQALKAAKHVLVEKPMALSVKEVNEIENESRRSRKIAMVGHTFLFNPAVRYLKKLIDTNELGQIRYIYSQRLNLGRIRSDVDALWNFAPHDISIIQYLLDNPDPVKIHRQGIDFVQPGVDDVVFLGIEYPNKVLAHIHVSWLDPLKVRRMTVVGSKKMVVYDDVAEDKIAVYDKGIDPKAVLGERMDFDRTPFAAFQHRSGDVWLPKISNEEPLQNELNHFLDCIEGKAQCLTGPEHAKKVVQILQGLIN
jgi:predicted dehydrogenase